MFEACADPSTLDTAMWLACYLTTPKHQLFYWSFGTVLLLLALAAPLIMALGFLGALAKRSSFWALRRVGGTYTAMVRGVPDIIFFLFVPIALDQGVEYLRHITLCPGWTEAVYQGNDFVVCDAAKAPLSSAAPWVHVTYNFTLALIAFGVVFGAFAANIIDGALKAVPKGQLETAAAYGMTPSQSFWRIQTPQMWVYALPGLSNLWMILVKATPLLFLLGVEDIVYWARELGGSKTSRVSAYPHPDWRVWYFLGLLVFYLLLTWVSEIAFRKIQARVALGQASAAGAAAAKAGGAAPAGGLGR